MESSIVQEQAARPIAVSGEPTDPAAYSSLRKTARWAGLLYFLGALTAFYAIMYVPSKTLVEGNAAATANNILAHEFIFRMGIASTLIGAVISVFFVMVLYRLFKQVNERQARLLVAFVLVQIPIGFLLEVFEITALMILKGEAWQTLAPDQRQQVAMLFLDSNRYGIMALELLWGMWLFPFGRLVYESGYIPRVFGVLLIINGIAYLIDSLTFLLFPDYKAMVQRYIFPLFFGELAIMLWLLIKGIKTPAARPVT